MNSSTRRHLVTAALAAPVMLAAKAQSNWPSRSIDYVAPHLPGGTTDILGRSIAQGIAAGFRQSVTVENKPSATGTIGGAFVTCARLDGYTILGTKIGPQTIVPHLLKGLSYDRLTAYAPVVLVGTMPQVLVVAPHSAFHSVQDLVVAARQKPSQVSFLSGGTGALLQIQGQLLRLQTGTQMLHVPHSNDVPAMQRAMAGQLNFAFLPLPAALPQVQSSKFWALAGVNGTIGQPSIAARLERLGVTIAGGTPQVLAKRQSADYARWGRVIKAAHITMG